MAAFYSLTIPLLMTGCSTSQSLSSEEEVTGVINSYLEALEAKDVSALVKYSNDIRFPAKEEQEQQYESIDQNITDTKLAKLTKVSENEFTAVVELVESGSVDKLTLPIQQREKEWKVIVRQDR